MTSYAGFIAIDSIASLKEEFPFGRYLAVIVGPGYPLTEALGFYDWQVASTAVPDDDEWVKPNFAYFDDVGRWQKIDVAQQPQFNSDWNATSGVTKILNKPVLASVATTGLYNDLGGKPSLATVATTGSYSDLTSRPALATVATSGSYNDLSAKPTIPTITPLAFGAPNARTVSLGTAYQATDVAKPAEVTINLTSNAALTLGGGSTFEADIVIGNTSGVASGTGTVIGKYKNSLTGSLVVGVALNNAQTSMHKFSLPAGWYFAVRQITGTGISVVSAFDQTVS